ncbi:MAG: gamma-glutamyltransferase [Acidimicrobiia bacterium]|nr:gamma-glutamyltransferase [Acidimicrobiia bacterium]
MQRPTAPNDGLRPGTVRAPHHLVASADHLATTAGTSVFSRGGNAVDAAVATNAVMAVTSPHLCGIGGDLFALVHVDGEVHALNASGRAGSGADTDALRAEGHREMPFRHDIRTVTVPGCVDGWLALHQRFGSVPLDDLLDPARRLATDGFPTSPLLAAAVTTLDARGRAALAELAEQATRPGARVRRAGVARVLTAIMPGDRTAFYEGEFGEGLHAHGGGLFSEPDLATELAEWVTPLSTEAFGVDLHTIPPNSQGYLTLAAARLADRLPLPEDTDDPSWAHLLIEAAAAAGHDRNDVLHEHADGSELIALIDDRLGSIDPARAARRTTPTIDGDTTYLCTAGRGPDGRLMGVSLIQSNASGFGSHLVEPATGINLHNRGLGFSLQPGHPAEFGPGRRPPHTLSPALATRGGDLAAVFGTMGGDAQPQILLQIAARIFHHGHSPGRAIDAARWALRGPATGFDTWAGVAPVVSLEGHAPPRWEEGLGKLGHPTRRTGAWDSEFGHAHAVVVEADGMLAGAADPRTRIGSCSGG